MNLNKGEIICPKCNGLSYIKYKHSYYETELNIECNKCLGEGKTNWVDNILRPVCFINISTLNFIIKNCVDEKINIHNNIFLMPNDHIIIYDPITKKFFSEKIKKLVDSKKIIIFQYKCRYQYNSKYDSKYETILKILEAKKGKYETK